MKVKELTLTSPDFPLKLQRLADRPGQVYFQGNNVNDLLAQPCVAVVGSRKVSAYGKAVTYDIVHALAKSRIVIISGLALGVDSIAHQAALDAGGITIAVLPGSLERIYPAAHRQLAARICREGGALMTEYAPGTPVYPSNFIARNRIVSACSDVVLITEAAARSGTLSTARFALEQGKDVLAIPGNITSPTSAGTNTLIQAGAALATSHTDVLRALGLPAGQGRAAPVSTNASEQTLLTLIYEGTTAGDALLTASSLDVRIFNQTLTMLEIQGRIRALGNNHWALAG